MNLYISHKAFRFSIFHYSLVVPLYLINNLDLHQVAIIESVYLLVFTFLLLPSGYAVDVIGSKICLIIGTFLIAVTDLLLYRAASFEDFFIILFVDAFSQALCSSADSVCIRFIMANNYSPTKFLRIESVAWVCRNLALGLSSVLGGILATFSDIKTALIVSLVMVSCSFICICAASIPRCIDFKFEDANNRSSCFSNSFLASLSAVRRISRRSLFLSIYFYAVDALGYMLVPIVLNQHKAAYWVYGSAFALIVITSSISHIAILNESKITLSSTLYTILTCIYVLLLVLSFEPWESVALPLVFFSFSLYGIVKGWYYPYTKACLIEEVETIGIGKVFSVILFASNLLASILIYWFLTLTNYVNLLTTLIFFLALTVIASIAFSFHKSPPLFFHKSS